MSGNNCGDFQSQIRDLQDENIRLQQEKDAMARQMRAAGVHFSAAKGDEIIVNGRDGAPRALDTADVQRGYQQLAGTMRSQEVDDLISRGLDTRARPVGSEGRFTNYDRLLREVDVKTIEDYARLAEALGITHERIAPDDFAFVTKTYNRERLVEQASAYYRDLGASSPDVLARASAKTAAMLNAVENKVYLRIWADRSKRLYLDTLDQIREFMVNMPGAEVPAELTQQAFRDFKFALVLERHNSLVKRRHAQALRSEQENILGVEQFRLDLGDEDEIREAIGMTAGDIGGDQHFGRVVDAIDNRDTKQLDLLIDAAKLDGLDPKSRLDKDWFNTHMRMANALVKDSQLGNINTQLLNVESNVGMMFYGPLQQTLYNGARLTPVANNLTRGPLLEAMQITGSALQYALGTAKATWRSDLSRVFQQGISHYSGNLDTYGKHLLTNQQELDDMQRILDMPYQPGRNGFTQMLNPNNVGLFGNKLQAAARILALAKPGGTLDTGMNRLEAAWTALGLDIGGKGVQRLSAKSIDLFTPWKPALRAMAGVDEVFGRYHYLFKLKADLEVKARMEGNQLGLFDDKDRAEWVQRQLDEAIYQATPTEENIKAFRKANGFKGSDFTDDEIGAMLAEANLQGAPTLATQESVDAMDFSAQMRFQNQAEGIAGKVDRGAMALRDNWAMDRYVLPYWKSLWNVVLFDHRLATGGLYDVLKMAGVKNPTLEQVAKAKAAWTMSSFAFLAFTALDATGKIHGSQDPVPARRNSIDTPLGNLKLGGLPVLNTLFLWKDIKDGVMGALKNEYDSNEVMGALGKVLSAHILRQAGVQQLHLVLNALLDGSATAWEKVRQAVAFTGSGQIPLIGYERQLERLTGTDRSAFYRDSPDTPTQQYLLGKDDPLAQTEQWLRGLLGETLPITKALMGEERKRTDSLGTPLTVLWGIDLSRAIGIGMPAVWPGGKINEVVYAELDAQDRGVGTEKALLRRNLEGVAMDDGLQREYNDIFGVIKGRQDLPPSRRLATSGRLANLTFAFPTESVSKDGIRFKETKTETVPLSPILDRYTAGKTRKEALYALFTSDFYRKLEDDPDFSATPPGGLPRTMRRSKAAQQLIDGINSYYDLLTQDELHRRAGAGTSPAAADWAEKLKGLARSVSGQSLDQIQRIGPVLKQGLPPAE